MKIEEWTAFFSINGKLPQTKIPCTKAGCTTETTMFGTNLEKRIKVYGSLEKLLTNFQCKHCRNADKPVKEVVAKKVKKTSKERKKSARQERTEELVESVRQTKIDISGDHRVKIDLKKNPELVAEFTQGACLRPDIFLDNDRACDGCVYFEHCACSLKVLSKKARKARKL
jgi:hypothetical protein